MMGLQRTYLWALQAFSNPNMALPSCRELTLGPPRGLGLRRTTQGLASAAGCCYLLLPARGEAERRAPPAVRDSRRSGLAMGRRILNDALRTMVNADRRGKATALLQPISGVMVSFLNIMKHRGYIKNFEVIDPHRVGKINVELHGRIKDCKALTYRQDLRAKEIEQYRVRILPTRQWGYVVITTPNGVLDHEEAIRQNVGGQVLGYFH